MIGKRKIKKRASKIVDIVTKDANDLLRMLELKGYSVTISIHETESLFIAMQSFLISGFKEDYVLALELVASYQKKILPFVNREEYTELTKFLNDTYVQYREIAIKVQYSSEQWQSAMLEEFAKHTITYIGTTNNDETVQTVISFISLLYKNINV